MQLVIDANIIMSILINPGKPLDTFFREEIEIFAPELLFEEIDANKDLIIKKTEFNKKEINTFIDILKSKIKIIPEEEFLEYREKSEKVCPDPKDITYFALALHLQCPIWSNEKKLKQQSEIRVYASHDLIKLFELDD